MISRELKKQYLNEELINLILEQIKKYKKSLDTRGRPNTISYITLCKIFIIKLEKELCWHYLSSIYNISASYLNTVFNKWSMAGVFENAYKEFLKQYHLFIDYSSAYVDSTIILNKYGYKEYCKYNQSESKKHRCTKLTTIISNNNIPIVVGVHSGNTSEINILKNIMPKIKHFKNLYGDKGYCSLSYKKYLKKRYKLNFVYPYKKNQKIKNTQEELDKLQCRIKIEHVNNMIKQNKALNTRYVKNNIGFKALAYLGCLKVGLQIIINDFFNF